MPVEASAYGERDVIVVLTIDTEIVSSAVIEYNYDINDLPAGVSIENFYRVVKTETA